MFIQKLGITIVITLILLIQILQFTKLFIQIYLLNVVVVPNPL